MSGPNLKAEVVLPFGDGEHLFALKFKQLELLEKACDGAISEIALRVIAMRPRLTDLYHVLLLGLEGGGMPPVEAKQMMDRYFDGRPLSAPNDPASPVITAAKVINAVWFGLDDLKPGEAAAGESPAAKSTSEPIEQAASEQG